MKARKMKNVKNKQPERVVRDFVSKNLTASPSCSAHKDKKNDYIRKPKHKEW